VLLRKVLAHPLQSLGKTRRQAAAHLAVDQHQHLAFTVKATAEVVADHLLAEVTHHRAVGSPAKGLGHLQAVAVHRPQLDDAELVERGHVLDALGLAQGVGGHDLLEGPLAQAAGGHQQQAAVGHHGLFLLQRQLAAQGLGVGDLAGELGEIHLQHTQHVVDA